MISANDPVTARLPERMKPGTDYRSMAAESGWPRLLRVTPPDAIIFRIPALGLLQARPVGAIMKPR
jgi:hypothetical protein